MFEEIKDNVLLIEVQKAVQTEKKSTARVLEYLSEIDRRRLWLKEGYSSLFDFCVRYLNYSEGETFRRIQASRLSLRIEEVKPLLEENSLSLTTLSLISPFLTEENAKELLPKVTNQSTRHVQHVLEEHFPEIKKKEEILKISLDKELEALLEKAKLIASETKIELVLKKVLQSYLKEKKTHLSKVKRHTHYVQRPLAREVKERDHYQCTYLSGKGIRCNQRAHLQIDHIRPYAKGGSSQDITNLRCLCRAHNLYLAKKDFPHFNLQRQETKARKAS